MLTFRLIVTMVAESCQLVILINPLRECAGGLRYLIVSVSVWSSMGPYTHSTTILCDIFTCQLQRLYAHYST